MHINFGAGMTRDVSHILGNIESLGDNCELGFYLRAKENETGSVFRWAICPVDKLIQFINTDAPRGGFVFEELVPYSPGMVQDLKTGFCFHTALRSIDTNGQLEFENTEAERREIHQREKGKYDYLLKKFEAGITGSDYKLYVIKANDGIDAADIDALNNAIAQRRNNKNFTLLHVSLGDEQACKHLVWKNETLVCAWIPEFASYSTAQDINESAWHNIFCLLKNEPRIQLVSLNSHPKVANAILLQHDFSDEQKRCLNGYHADESNSQKIERCYAFAKCCENEQQLNRLFGFLKSADNEFHDLLGGEIVTALNQDAQADTLTFFDDKYLNLSQLYSNFSLESATALHASCEDLYKQHGNSYIRYERLKNAFTKSGDLLDGFIENDLELFDVSPKASGNLVNHSIGESESIMDQPGVASSDSCIYTVKLDEYINRDHLQLWKNDDSQAAANKWINDIKTYTISGVHFFKLHNARIGHAPTGVAFKEKGAYKYIYEMSDMYHYFRVTGQAAFRPKRKSLDLAYILPRFGINNYYHSLVDKLPALFGYKFLGLDCPIITTFDLHPVERHFAKLIGIDADKIITGENGEVEADNAFLPDIANLRPLFFRFCANLGAQTGAQATRKIYISRVNSPDRPMINEEQIEQLALSQGFEVIRMEDYTLEEQIAIAASASSIMAPHGAGLANMVFAKAGCEIIELIPDKYMTPLFKQLAANCGHRYSVLMGDTEDAADAKLAWRANSDRLETVLANAA
ncbi:MAG: glycosyltransferase family 61 protein [Granulosicoccus sp.]|nr:glycosyltransferase family 61 protein [Granulosicoccus sp.]